MTIGIKDAWFHLSQLGIVRPWSEAGDRIIEGPISMVSFRDAEISTRDLIECAAIVDEGFAFGGLGESHGKDYYEMWALALLQSSGGKCIEIASRLAGRLLGPGEMLSLIDYALNPPIPLFDAGAHKVAWQEFYPPCRFAAAARALHSHDITVEGDRSSGGIQATASSIEETTGMRLGTMDAPLSTAPRLGQAFATGLSNHYGVLLYAARDLHDLRRIHPEAISHFGWATTCGDSPLCTLLLEDSLSGAYAVTDSLSAPFLSIDGSFEVTPPASAISAAYIVSVAAFSGAHDIVAGVSPSSIRHLPADLLSNLDFRARVDDLLLEISGMPFEWPGETP